MDIFYIKLSSFSEPFSLLEAFHNLNDQYLVYHKCYSWNNSLFATEQYLYLN